VKPIVCIAMDNVPVDFKSGIERLCLLFLNPPDNHGIRFILSDIASKIEWHSATHDEHLWRLITTKERP
jgi:hypothetical protein